MKVTILIILSFLLAKTKCTAQRAEDFTGLEFRVDSTIMYDSLAGMLSYVTIVNNSNKPISFQFATIAVKDTLNHIYYFLCLNRDLDYVQSCDECQPSHVLQPHNDRRVLYLAAPLQSEEIRGQPSQRITVRLHEVKVLWYFFYNTDEWVTTNIIHRWKR